MTEEHEPRAEYERRLGARRASADAAERREARLSNLRLAVFALGAPALWWIWSSPDWSLAWALAPVTGFFAAVAVHDATRREHRRARRAVAFYERGLARLDHRFAGAGREGRPPGLEEHAYADHLDLFGRGSLFELLSAAQTAAGERTLASWLLEPAPADEIRGRNAAVDELRTRVGLREDIAVLGPEVRSGLDPEALASWGTAPPVFRSGAYRWIAAAFTALAVSVFAAWVAGLAPALAVALVLAIQGGVGLALRGRVRGVIGQLERPSHDLQLLSELLARIEAEAFGAPRLERLRRALDTDGAPPSRCIAQLRRRIDWLDSRRNQLLAPIAPLLLWATHCALAVEAWRARCGPHLEVWLDAVGEIEALLDLAAYAYEHPEDPFPEIVDGEPRFEGEGIGHPLLAARVRVRNDVSLGPECRLLVVSGSNMSGKSTLLRTLGVNAVLAQAGAPVCARHVKMSPLAIGATLRIVDSLQEGSSRFWAEITALRRVVALTDSERPVLFLLDELLHGTNSRDRRAGATAVVRGLIARGAIGLITTHDLALAGIADALDGHAANVHFEDRLEEGELRFDYRLRPGLAERSNALELMRAVGLDV